jgi:hypothetical protein
MSETYDRGDGRVNVSTSGGVGRVVTEMSVVRGSKAVSLSS